MLELFGQYNTARVFSDQIDKTTREQVVHLLDQPFVQGSKIRVMPDAHAGAGCTIGTTMTITDKVVPNLVGVDIGCGMQTIKLDQKALDFKQLDRLIRQLIPSGFNVRKRPHDLLAQINLEQLHCKAAADLSRAERSIGTLGGGNHFIEIDRDEDMRLYLVIHTGSRNLGKQTAQYYQQAASRRLQGQGIDKQLAYCEGELLEQYLMDMKLVQRFADLNRQAIADEIIQAAGLTVLDRMTTVHNYIDLDQMILRKGAVSARRGERLLIPFNMRDGSLIAVGRGNPDWNFSAPHGAGRRMSRHQARKRLSLEAFQSAMSGIYTTTANRSTIDEAPDAYKSPDVILSSIAETCDIEHRLRPVYNFKAAE